MVMNGDHYKHDDGVAQEDKIIQHVVHGDGDDYATIDDDERPRQ